MKFKRATIAIPLAVLACAIALPSEAIAQATYEAAKSEMQKRMDAAKASAAKNPDQKVWDFVVADKKIKTVTVFACGTNIRPTDAVEFFVTPVASGKDYESLTVTFARPSDIRAAMEFVGIKPGQAVDFEKNRYWPRGPRVVMNYTIAGKPVRAESMLIDTNTQQPLRTSGLVYTGSYTYTDEAGKTHVAADDSDGRPIAPNYNDPAALFDVPAQAPQSQVYGFRKPSPQWTVKPGEAVDVVIRDTTSEGNLTVAADPDLLVEWNLQISIAPAPTIGILPWTAYSFMAQSSRLGDAVITSPPDLWTKRDSGLATLVTAISELANGHRDLFTTVAVHPSIPITDVRNLYGVLQAVEKDRGVKLDPPPAGELFHRAFFPQVEWRDRSSRLGEPWELFLTRNAGKLAAKLERVVENSDRAASDRKVVESVSPADPAAFAKHVNDHASRWSRTIFIYPPADLTYGELMTWVRPVMGTYPRVFIFPPEEAPASSSTQPATPSQP